MLISLGYRTGLFEAAGAQPGDTWRVYDETWSTGSSFRPRDDAGLAPAAELHLRLPPLSNANGTERSTAKQG